MMHPLTRIIQGFKSLQEATEGLMAVDDWKTENPLKWAVSDCSDMLVGINKDFEEVSGDLEKLAVHCPQCGRFVHRSDFRQAKCCYCWGDKWGQLKTRERFYYLVK